MRKSHLLLALFISFSSICNALEIESTSGGLAATLQNNKDISSLTISGTMDARDFKFINDELNNLTTIDISKVSITSFSGNIAYFGTELNYAENCIPALAMFGKGYNTIKLPATITAIGDGALSGCKNITEITIPESVTTIGDYAFYDCDKIESITIPANVAKMGKYTFSKSDNLARVTLNTSAPIADFSFSHCEKLSNVIFAKETNMIGNSSFLGCKMLTTMTFPSSISSIGEDAFKGVAIANVDLSECNKLTTIGKWAFADNKELLSVRLPNALTSLGDGAFFYNSNLNTISLPAGVTTISDFLLTGCSSVNPKDIIGKDVTDIGKYVFADWSQVATFLIPENVKYIGDNAFENWTNISSIEIKAVQAPELGENVFKGIDQPKTTLYVPTESENSYRNAMQWNEFEIIVIGSGVNDANAVSAIKAYFQVSTLVIKAAHTIKNVRLFDTNGILLTHIAPNSETAQVETDLYFGNNYIVNVELENGYTQNFKLARK